ncbi:MAG: class I SAM-dependent methyltransferase [Defluviitaleaceae bacterium]|nr:class I SAM-dependent methyltransferase [Defluviitaleaceae bacterium]
MENNTNLFSGKAEAYANARPTYPDTALDYIVALFPTNAVIADIGAGTGKLSLLLAQRGYGVFAVEPNNDMREILIRTLAPFPNARVISGTAENTTLPSGSIDVITCAQALHWFAPNEFRAECLRIGKNGVLVAAVYNIMPNGSSVSHSKQSTDVFFTSPTVQAFPNTQFYTRERWLTYMTSHSRDPLPSDEGYDCHIKEMGEVFEQESVDGLLRRDVVTYIYSEVVI